METRLENNTQTIQIQYKYVNTNTELQTRQKRGIQYGAHDKTPKEDRH